MEPGRRILLVGLDGYEASLGEALMAKGKLPHLRNLRERSARFLLDHGVEKYSGLTWEHLSVGQSPREHEGRWSAIHFDTKAYDVIQLQTVMTPFFARLPVQSVVFDCPYFDLGPAPGVQGIVGWGAHDAGVATQSNPTGLVSEMQERFGEFKGKESLYGFSWVSPSRTKWLGETLVRAANQRAEVAHWLLSDRLPDWRVALVVSGELHSVIEPLWHGMDPNHPLHSLPSAEPAAQAVEDVYDAVDRLLGKLISAHPDATVLAFAMHGMGPNDADVASMVLLPELLYRKRFGRSLLSPRPEWDTPPFAMLGEDEAWDESIRAELKHSLHPPQSRWSRLRDTLTPDTEPRISAARRANSLSVDWIPATQYKRYWPEMEAFALPAYYHGRIRLNLRGREARGKVRGEDYERVCDEVRTLLMECRHPETGEACVKSVDRFVDCDPAIMNETEADLDVIWNHNPTVLEHPKLGRIGPVPHRRTGGHTGAHGIAYLSGPGIEPGDRGPRSSFDIAPTVFGLLGEPIPDDISGRSLVEAGA